MNIDFHYGVIYIVSRLAGFDPNKAETIAHACQYVDDSTVKGVLEFSGGQSYERFASAHKMLDYKNLLNDSDKLVWSPFHFVPGGAGDSLDDMAMCRPDSAIAQEIVRRALEGRSAENALHRLGITMHVYVDTWAHHGFAGTISNYNVVTDLKSDNHEPGFWKARLKSFLNVAEDEAESEFLDHVSKLGHGAALHFPDLPWGKWEYTNGHGEHVVRDNLPEFVEAANMAHRVARGFLNSNADYKQEDGLQADASAALQSLFDKNRSEDPDERLAYLAKAVADGEIPGIKENIPRYIGKGPGSWKHAATGITATDDDGDGKPEWSDNFEQSDYRKFHDAAKEHRFVLMQEILPKRGVRLA